MHCETNWPREKPPSDFDLGVLAGTGDAGYLALLAPALARVIEESRAGLVFYNAGVDPHREDRLGLLGLSDSGLYRRDRMVAEACARAGLPLCAVLGGGYSKDAGAVARRHLLMVEALDAAFD